LVLRRRLKTHEKKRGKKKGAPADVLYKRNERRTQVRTLLTLSRLGASESRKNRRANFSEVLRKLQDA